MILWIRYVRYSGWFSGDTMSGLSMNRMAVRWKAFIQGKSISSVDFSCWKWNDFLGCRSYLKYHHFGMSNTYIIYRGTSVDLWFSSRSSNFFFRATEFSLFGSDIFKPFTQNVWIAISVSVILLSVLLKFLMNYERGEADQVSSFILSLGAFCQQSFQRSISMPSSRCFVLFLFISSAMVYRFYTSKLVSIIVDPRYESKIQNKEDLANSDMSIGFLNTSSITSFIDVSVAHSKPSQSTEIELVTNFQTTRLAEFEDFFNKKLYSSNRSIDSFLITSPQEGFRRVQRKNFAFHCEQSTANDVVPKLFAPHEICDLKSVVFRPDDNVAMTVKKHSPFRERFAINWFWLREIGVTYKTMRFWEGPPLRCISNAHFESVGLRYVITIFLSLMLTHVVAALILMCEIYVRKLKSIPTWNAYKVLFWVMSTFVFSIIFQSNFAAELEFYCLSSECMLSLSFT